MNDCQFCSYIAIETHKLTVFYYKREYQNNQFLNMSLSSFNTLACNHCLEKIQSFANENPHTIFNDNFNRPETGGFSIFFLEFYLFNSDIHVLDFLYLIIRGCIIIDKSNDKSNNKSVVTVEIS